MPVITSVALGHTNVISLFGDELDESSDEEESDTEFDFFDFEEVREWCLFRRSGSVIPKDVDH